MTTLRLEPSDFHVMPDGTKVGELFIRCTFESLTPDEEARFSNGAQMKSARCACMFASGPTCARPPAAANL